MILIIEIITLCLLFTATVISGNKKDPLGGLHNLPKKIQERVNILPEYADRKTEILTSSQRIRKKLPALIILAAAFCGLIYLAGARTFGQGLGYSFILWTAIKLYVTLVLNCCWYAHTPSAWIKGTEDLEYEYRNYKHYLSSVPRSLIAGAIVSAVVGTIIMLIVQL